MFVRKITGNGYTAIHLYQYGKIYTLAALESWEHTKEQIKEVIDNLKADEAICFCAPNHYEYRKFGVWLCKQGFTEKSIGINPNTHNEIFCWYKFGDEFNSPEDALQSRMFLACCYFRYDYITDSNHVPIKGGVVHDTLSWYQIESKRILVVDKDKDDKWTFSTRGGKFTWPIKMEDVA